MATGLTTDTELVEPDDGSDALDVDLYEEGDEEEGKVQPAPFVLDEDSPNIVADVLDAGGAEELERIGDFIVEAFDEAYRDGEEYRNRMKKDWKLFSGVLDKKRGGFRNAANANVPILLENISRMSLRTYGEIFPPGSNFFNALPTSSDPRAREEADLLTLHGNWQLQEDVPDFLRQQARGLLIFWINGDVTTHSYYDPDREQNRHEVLTPEDVVVPYTMCSTMPDWSDVPWLCRIQYLYRHQIQKRREDWEYVAEVLEREPPDYFNEPDRQNHEAQAKDQGNAPDNGDFAKNRPYKVLMWEGWLSLFDDDERFFKAIVDYESRKVMLLTLWELPDWKERERYDMQTQELQLWHQEQQERQQLMQQAMQPQVDPMSGLPIPPPPIEALAEQFPQPPPPSWAAPDDPAPQPRPMKRKPVRLWQHAVAIEPLFGNLGNSYGRILGDYNRAGNVLLNQFIDSGTLHNSPMFMVSSMLGLPENLTYEAGKFINVNAAPDEIARAILPLRTEAPSSAMPQALGMINEMARAAAQSPEVLSGAPGKSGETKGGLALRVQQVQQILTVLGGVYAAHLKGVVQNNALLNYMNLPEEELLMLVDPATRQQGEYKVRRDMYGRNYRVRLTTDLRFASKEQRVAEKQEALALLGLPWAQLVASTNPIAVAPYARKAIGGVLEAMGQQEMVEYLGPQMPPPTLPDGSPMPFAPAPPPPPMPPEGAPSGEPPPEGA